MNSPIASPSPFLSCKYFDIHQILLLSNGCIIQYLIAQYCHHILKISPLIYQYCQNHLTLYCQAQLQLQPLILWPYNWFEKMEVSYGDFSIYTIKKLLSKMIMRICALVQNMPRDSIIDQTCLNIITESPCKLLLVDLYRSYIQGKWSHY